MGSQPDIYPAPKTYDADPLFQSAHAVVKRLRESGFEAFFAGGFSRDLLIGRPLHDIDITTNAIPDHVLTLFPDSRAFGKSFGVVQVEYNNHLFEVATFRVDKDYRDGRRPESVTFTTADEDAKRRDFTINGMLFDPDQHVIIDYVGGWPDIQARLIRAIGNPALRFTEDHLRLMRAVRFSCVLGFTIEPATWEAIRANANSLQHISAERIRDEMLRMLMETPQPSQALRQMCDAGILSVIFPELVKLIGVQQPPEFHPEGDVFEHVCLMLDLMTERSHALIWSILLHDIAKPDTFAIGTDKEGKPRIRFNGHAELGAEMAKSIMRRFRCSNDMMDQVSTTILHHMRFISVPEMRSATKRKWVGSPTFPLELELHKLDCLSSHRKMNHHEYMVDFQQQLAQEPMLPTALISGRDLMAAGYVSGPSMGQLLKKLYDAQLEGVFTSKEDGLKWLRQQPSDKPPGESN